MIGNSRGGPTASPIEIIYLGHWSRPAPAVASAFKDRDRAPLVAHCCCCCSLLLLLLLVPASARRPELRAGSNDHTGRHFGRSGRVRGADKNSDAEFALRSALVDTARGRDVGIVASQRHFNVTALSQTIVRRVQSDPSRTGHERLHPGVRRALDRAVGCALPTVKVAAHVTARDLQLAG